MATVTNRTQLDILKEQRRQIKGTLPLTPAERKLNGKAADAYVEQLTKELEALYRRTARDLQGALLSGNLTMAKQARLQALLDAVSVQVAALHKAAATYAGKAVALSYMRGVDTSTLYLDALGYGNLSMETPAGRLDVDSLFGTTLHRDAVAVVTDSLVQDLVGANLSIEQTAARFIRESQLAQMRDAEISRQVARGIIEGRLAREVTNDILQGLQDKIQSGGFVSVGGKQYKADYYAGLLARTRTREAVNHGRLNFAYEHDIDLFGIDTHESACPYCRQYVGRVYSITGATPGFPRLTVMPPYHPHCKCNGYPVPVEHLEAMPYFEELKRFSNDPNASFEEFEQARQQALAGTKYEILPFGTSADIKLGSSSQAKARASSSASPIRTADFTQYAERLHIRTSGFEHSDTLRTITVEALHELSAKKLVLPAQMVVDASRFVELYGADAYRYLALYDGSNGLIRLNPKAPFWNVSLEAAENAIKDNFRDGIWSSGHRSHPIFHEYAHFEHDTQDPEAYRSSMRVRFTAVEAALIEQEVSEIAAQNAAEFVAEVRAGVLASKAFGERIMEWYNRYGGPK